MYEVYRYIAKTDHHTFTFLQNTQKKYFPHTVKCVYISMFSKKKKMLVYKHHQKEDLSIVGR